MQQALGSVVQRCTLENLATSNGSTREERPRKVENYASDKVELVLENVPSVWFQISEEWHNVVQFP